MSPTHNWTITGRARSDWPFSVASTTTAILRRVIPESTRRDWEIHCRSAKTRAFGSCSAPHPSLKITGHRANPVNRTVRGNGFVSNAASSTTSWQPVPRWDLSRCRSSLNKCVGADTFCNPNAKPKAGSEVDSVISCSLICVLFVSSASGGFLFLD